MLDKQDNFYKIKLKNGLTILFEKRNIPVISISSAIKFGSGYDSLEKKGIAHFIEHLMFKGTKKRTAKEIAEQVEKKGGVINAFTSEDVTCYWNKLPAKHLSTGIDITSDLILNPLFDKIEFEKEKKVILEEIKMYHDSPHHHVREKIMEMLYEKPFGIIGTGTEKSLLSISRADVVNKFDSVYGVNNMILSVVGKADFSEICELAEKHFPVRNKTIQDYLPVKKNFKEVELREGIDQAHFALGFHSSSMMEKGKYADELALAYLAGGMSSVLFQEIREKRGLAYSVSGDLNIGKNFGYSMIYAGTLKEHISKIQEIILKEIKNLAKIQKKDFEETQEQLIGLKQVETESSDNVMSRLLTEEISGEAEEYYLYEDRISALKLEDIRKLSKLKQFSSFSLIPKI